MQDYYTKADNVNSCHNSSVQSEEHVSPEQVITNLEILVVSKYNMLLYFFIVNQIFHYHFNLHITGWLYEFHYKISTPDLY